MQITDKNPLIFRRRKEAQIFSANEMITVRSLVWKNTHKLMLKCPLLQVRILRPSDPGVQLQTPTEAKRLNVLRAPNTANLGDLHVIILTLVPR